LGGQRRGGTVGGTRALGEQRVDVRRPVFTRIGELRIDLTGDRPLHQRGAAIDLVALRTGRIDWPRGLDHSVPQRVLLAVGGSV
jgi:hypothetical protein